MAKSLPPLTWFRSFEAAARHLSFTAAAEEIGLTQSAISQQVKSLELRLRVTLFIRQPRGLSLTDEGRRLLPQVGAALESLADAAQSFDGPTSAGTLTVATSVSLAQWVLAPRLPDFRAAYPNRPIRFISTIWPDDFQAPLADVEIRFGSEKQVGQGAEALLPRDLIAVKSTKLAGSIETLPLIETVGTSAGWQVWAERYGGSRHADLFADNYGMALQLATSGNGIALVSQILASQAIQNGDVERAHEGSVPAQEGYFLWTRPDNADAAAFRQWLMGVL